MFTTKVERHSFGIKNVSDHSKVSSGMAANEYLQKKAVLEQFTVAERETQQAEQRHSYQQAEQNIYTRKLLESQIPVLINEINQNGRDRIFKEVLFEMFSKSLVLDEEFVIEHEDNLRALIESYIDGKGGYALLENAYRETKSPFLKSIKVLCEGTANKVARRKMNEAQENQLDVSAIKFELNDDEKQELDYEKEKINVDQLSKLVKDKVLTVVQDEKARQAKEDEVYRDLEQETEEGQTVEESIKRSLIRDLPIEESTLFNSLFRHSYKEVLESIAAATGTAATDDSDADDADQYDEDATEDDVLDNHSTDGEIKTHGAVSSDIDMDLILAESITKYTLMELSYTIQLENYNYDSIRKISQNLLN